MVGCALLQFAQMAILARLLAPADFGLMAVVFSVILFMQVFTDLGVSNAIIHHKEVSRHQLSSLYWLNVLVSLGLMLLVMVSSPFVSGVVFKQPALQPILMTISTNYLVLASGQQLRVMAQKNLHFSVLSKIELVAGLAGFATAVGWAWYAPSVYAIVAGVLINGIVQSCLLWLFAAQGWRPEFRLDLREIRAFLQFGGFVLADSFVNSFNRQVDVLIGGALFPAATLGLYSLPRNLNLRFAGIINPVITRVALPVMAKMQHDREFLKKVYLKTMRMAASVNFPVYLALMVFSKEVVLLVFGIKWVAAAPLLSYLAVWGMLRSTGNPVGSLLLAVGRPDLSFKWNLALLFVIPPILWIGVRWGIEGLALSQAALMAALLIPAWYFLIRPSCGASGREYAVSLLEPLLCALIAVAVGYVAAMPLSSPLLRLMCAASAVLPAYVASSYVFNRSWLLAMGHLIRKT